MRAGRAAARRPPRLCPGKARGRFEMHNPGMDEESFEQFIDQLDRYVRERLIPAEREMIAQDRIPDDILAEMKQMGLFGLSIPEEYGGAGLNTSQYARTVRSMSYAAPAFRSIFSINIGMFNSAIKKGGTQAQQRQEAPTSELQSLMRNPYSVFLLKKNKQQNNQH